MTDEAVDILGTFEGASVRRAAITIPNAAGGLRDALKIEPQVFRAGDHVTVVMDLVCVDLHFPAIDKAAPGGDRERVHVFKAEGATFIDRELVASVLDEQCVRIEAAKDAESGQERIDGAKLDLDHFEGKHADALVAGCAKCDEERELIAEERDAEVAAIPTTKGRKVKDAPQA